MATIHSIYDPGTARFPEDASAVRLPFAVVADGVSAPYRGNPRRFRASQWSSAIPCALHDVRYSSFGTSGTRHWIGRACAVEILGRRGRGSGGACDA